MPIDNLKAAAVALVDSDWQRRSPLHQRSYFTNIMKLHGPSFALVPGVYRASVR